MNTTFTGELLSHFKPNLKAVYATRAVIPLFIKLELERIRLAELVRASRLGDVASAQRRTQASQIEACEARCAITP